MLTRLRDQVGTAGLVVAIVALVAALGGGAYAASKGLNSTQKKEVKKIAKSFQGTGPAGAAGAAGPAGPAGPKGDTGAAGAAGKDGVSATTSTFSGTKGNCKAGGLTVKSASPEVNVCNGEDGETGFTETLPAGMTETGTFGRGGSSEDLLPISFPIPLAEPLDKDHTHIAPNANCPGTASAPIAAEGHLCIYIAGNEGSTGVTNGFPSDASSFPAPEGGAATAGMVLYVKGGEAVWGTWAVTATAP